VVNGLRTLKKWKVKKTMTYCCKKLEDNAGAFHFDREEELWGVHSPDGVYIWKVSDMKFCPFCGKTIESTKKQEGKKEK
jgi:hypothetical protein